MANKHSRTPVGSLNSHQSGVSIFAPDGTRIAVLNWRSGGEIPYIAVGHISPTTSASEEQWAEMVQVLRESLPKIHSSKKALIRVPDMKAVHRILDAIEEVDPVAAG